MSHFKRLIHYLEGRILWKQEAHQTATKNWTKNQIYFFFNFSAGNLCGKTANFVNSNENFQTFFWLHFARFHCAGPKQVIARGRDDFGLFPVAVLGLCRSSTKISGDLVESHFCLKSSSRNYSKFWERISHQKFWAIIITRSSRMWTNGQENASIGLHEAIGLPKCSRCRACSRSERLSE